MGRISIILFVCLLGVGVTFITYLGRTVVSDLDALSTARHDDINWNMSQLEIETLNLNSAAHNAVHGHDSDLSVFRKRYDIYYSRVRTLTQSAFYNVISKEPDAQVGLAAIAGFMDEVTPIVDGPDAGLRAALPDVQRRVEDLRPQVRDLSLAGIQVFAKEDAMRRAALSQTLVKLAASIFGLILFLLFALATLLKVHRRRQQAAHENLVMRSRFEVTLASSLDAVLVVDTNGRIMDFNGAAETVFGYSRAEALGGDMADMIVPQHMREMHRKGMARFLETGKRKIVGAGRVRLDGLRKSGEVFPVELSISLSEVNGERVFVSFLRDITRELETEAQVRAARDKAQEGEKAKSDLLTVMSHEMRTPLNGILGSLALLDKERFDDRQKRLLNSISVSGELLLSHVNDVLDLSSLEKDAPRREKVNFDLAGLLQQVTESLMANAEARGNRLLLTRLSDDLKTVTGAKRALQQCLVNLLGNAIKFTADGRVSVEAERLNGGDLVEIRVSDTGVGIAPENMDRIFDEFVTIDTAYARQNTGTGLGLAITKRLVEGMGGTLEAESLLGEGSLFTLRVPLPVAQVEPHLGTHVSSKTADSQSYAHRALVVDDNDINRMILREMLLGAGLRVEEAADGFEAIKHISQERFDIVFLDISMPGIDGIETLHRIRQLPVDWRNLPAIAVTAHAAPKDHNAIMQASFLDLLVKPVHPREIEAKLASVLAQDTGTTSVSRLETAGANFRAQFGEAEYRKALTTFETELNELHHELAGLAALTDEARSKAHKLSGSAAILGQSATHARLQTIEHCETEAWDELKEHLFETSGKA
ncbi:hybrid sensor histidine kinase/response regulator [Roseobacter denitrificans]|uniref:ATP-binding protein n=1 Tax=Roseobacter denitrificans TaxID=2434 RepID=UPI000308168E|nr:ATP-binding protein [Roseobacter denitrificans]AVL52431.1 hybrid sensor histidine kinase/response regulator [Roseobacter denitrificans]SFG08728.1 PAS/PAC sensor hybrid histidine kinase [Roseobacter denitrificans OCh 114]